MKSSIPAAAAEAAERWGDALALEETSIVDGSAIRLSFSALWERCLGAARAFIAAGVEPGDRVAVWAPNCHEWILAAIGAQCAGAALVPMNTRFKAKEAAYVLQKSGAKLLVSIGDFLGTDYLGSLERELGAPGAQRLWESLPALERVIELGPASGKASWRTPVGAFIASGESTLVAEAKARAASVGPDDTSDILFTSGTTGHPKGVVTTHSQNVRAFTSWTEVVGLRAGDRYLIVNPFFHAFGYKAGWLACLLRGATILPHLVFDPGQVLRRIAADQVSMLPGPPALYQAILAHPELRAHDVSSLRLAVTGAASIPVDLIHRMRDVLGLETIITGYGLTECCGIVAMCRYDDDPETIAKTSGRAIEGVEMIAVNDAGEPVAPGEPGEIVVRGYNVMRGYFDDERATREAVDPDGWLHTGDIGIIDERGYVRITDRKKDMFIMGGFNCYPAEIENLMLSHPELVSVAVIGVPDERMGEVGMAFAVRRPESSLDVDALRAWCRENLANYKVPRYFELVDALPMNATGKVTKFVLRERATALLKGA
ncbi:MAG: AMP-binding protein [Polyangiaceae bacterium]|nr:AMP-binding protein [Polyangiaceae bacterium]MCB9606159.1 AMP-binding protein [Polyangiaceae bacterium]